MKEYNLQLDFPKNTFQELDLQEHTYFLPKENEKLRNETLVPALSIAERYDCMMAFFDTKSIRYLSTGLAEFLKNQQAIFRLIISPNLSQKDLDSFEFNNENSEDVLRNRLIELLAIKDDNITVDGLEKHTLTCLAYLLKQNRLQIKVTYTKSGIFHHKAMMLYKAGESLLIHGSANMTQAGFIRNAEDLHVSMSWKSTQEKEKNDKFTQSFKDYWKPPENELNTVKTLDLTESIREGLIDKYDPSKPPTPKEYENLWNRFHSENTIKQKFNIRNTITIPPDIDFQSGKFSHQAKAIEKWEQNNRIGMLQMATGSGKTKTALISVARLVQKEKKLLVVILVPYVVLLNQWRKEVENFGIKPILMDSKNVSKNKSKMFSEAVENLELDVTDTEIIICTDHFAKTTEFHNILDSYNGPSLIIGDEVHHYGSVGFMKNPPNQFIYRLGLSATPIRGYDEEGTKFLESYFGPIVFTFTLQEAIGKCLVNYKYFVHKVLLTFDELEQYEEYSRKIRPIENTSTGKKLSSKEHEIQQILLNKRRGVLEQAENKIQKLEELLQNETTLKHTLIYASAKNYTSDSITHDNTNHNYNNAPDDGKQISKVMDTLNKVNIKATSVSSNNPIDFESTIRNFVDGNIQVLVAMKVLDEGFDVQEISKAYILASGSTEREWIQRRGRILRICNNPLIDKQYSVIHDFIVLPESNQYNQMESTAKKILANELIRVKDFAELSINYNDENGARETIVDLINTYL